MGWAKQKCANWSQAQQRVRQTISSGCNWQVCPLYEVCSSTINELYCSINSTEIHSFKMRNANADHTPSIAQIFPFHLMLLVRGRKPLVFSIYALPKNLIRAWEVVQQLTLPNSWTTDLFGKHYRDLNHSELMKARQVERTLPLWLQIQGKHFSLWEIASEDNVLNYRCKWRSPFPNQRSIRVLLETNLKQRFLVFFETLTVSSKNLDSINRSHNA